MDAELNPAQQRSFEPPDRYRGSQVLVGLADDQVANAVFCPAGFDDTQHEADHHQDDDDQTDRCTDQERRNRSDAAKATHRSRSYRASRVTEARLRMNDGNGAGLRLKLAQAFTP